MNAIHFTNMICKFDYMISLQVLTKKKQKNYKGTSRFSPQLPNPWPQKVNANLNLTCKNILSKTKETMKYFQLL